MTQRIDLASMVPDFYTAMIGIEKAVRASGIDPVRYEVVKIRASQLNGCAYCLDMHTRNARKGRESQRRLDVLSAWREAPSFFTHAERAGLALTKATTLIAEDGVPTPVWDDANTALGEQGVAQVITAVVAINCWNRLAGSTHQDLSAGA